MELQVVGVDGPHTRLEVRSRLHARTHNSLTFQLSLCRGSAAFDYHVLRIEDVAGAEVGLSTPL
jgi:hypothetical protein